MILDAKHKTWAISTVALALAALALYALSAWQMTPVRPSGGSPSGLWFGMAGFVLLVFAGLLPLRKWWPLARIGSAQTWLRAHIWLSLLGSLLIVLHAGFRWRGSVEQVLMLLLAFLVASGIWGLVAQRILTRQLTRQIAWETFYENLPYECLMLQFEGDVVVARVCEAPLPLAPEPSIATDERLKNRGVMGRDYEARLARVYQSSIKATPPTVEDPNPAAAAASQENKSDAAARANDNLSPSPPGKPMSAADKIAMMRAKKGTAAPAPAVVTGPESSVATLAPVAAETPAATAKKMTAAEKIALMRAKPQTAAPVAEASTVPDAKQTAAEPSAAEAAITGSAKSLSTADKLKLMRAKKPAAEDSQPAPVAAASEATPAAAGPALSTKDKLAMMRAGQKEGPAVAGTPAAAPTNEARPAPSVTVPAERRQIKPPAQPAPTRTSDPQDLAPFRQALRSFFLERLRPFLNWDRRGVAEELSLQASADVAFARLRASLPSELHEAAIELEALAGRRRELSQQARLYHWLHLWLVLVHIPAAAAMFALAAVHIVAALYW